jgi:hypothetical protein
MEDALASQVQLMPAVITWNDTPPVVPNSDGYYPVAVPGQSIVF